MPNREDETWLNMNPHPENCSCTECIRKRKRIKYPYPAEFECPACGNISLYFSDDLLKFKCMHEICILCPPNAQELKKCPYCFQTSVFVSSDKKSRECLNTECTFYKIKLSI